MFDYENQRRHRRSTGPTEEERHEMTVRTILETGNFTFNAFVALSNGESEIVPGIKADNPRDAVRKAARFKLKIREEDYILEKSAAKNISDGKTYSMDEDFPR